MSCIKICYPKSNYRFILQAFPQDFGFIWLQFETWQRLHELFILNSGDDLHEKCSPPCTVCLKSLDSYHIVSYYIKWVKTFRIHSIIRILQGPGEADRRGPGGTRLPGIRHDWQPRLGHLCAQPGRGT